MNGDSLSVERVIDATAHDIFVLLSDAAKHETFDGSGTVKGTRKESVPLELGSTFGMSMRMGVPYRTGNEVVEFEPDLRIAWKTSGLKGLAGGRIWRYELEPRPDGRTLVRETWDLSEDKQAALLKRSPMVSKTEKAMTQTLERLAAAVTD